MEIIIGAVHSRLAFVKLFKTILIAIELAEHITRIHEQTENLVWRVKLTNESVIIFHRARYDLGVDDFSIEI